MKPSRNQVARAAGLFALLAGGVAVAEEGPVEYVRVCDTFGTGFYYIPGTETCLKIGGDAGYAGFSVPEVGYITRVLPSSERFFGVTKERLDGYDLGANISFGTKYWRNDLSFTYGYGEGSTSTWKPAGGDSIAITYFDLAPNDSTGLGLGAVDAWLDTRSTFQHFRFDYAALFPLDGANVGLPGTPSFGIGSRKYIGATFSYEYAGQDHWSYFQTETYPGVTSEANQSVDENLFGFGPRFTCETRITPRLSVGTTVDVLAYHRTASLDSMQYNRCDLGACAPDQTAFDVLTKDHDSGFAWGSKLSANVDFTVGRGLTLGASVYGNFISQRAQIINPEHPVSDGGGGYTVIPPYLGAQSAFDSGVKFRVQRSF